MVIHRIRLFDLNIRFLNIRTYIAHRAIKDNSRELKYNQVHGSFHIILSLSKSMSKHLNIHYIRQPESKKSRPNIFSAIMTHSCLKIFNIAYDKKNFDVYITGFQNKFIKISKIKESKNFLSGPKIV